MKTVATSTIMESPVKMILNIGHIRLLIIYITDIYIMFQKIFFHQPIVLQR